MSPKSDGWDVVVVGAGMAGCALASHFADSGFRVVLVERGDYVKPEPANWDAAAVVSQNRYETTDVWGDGKGGVFRPRIYHNVGGSSKFFGGSAFRYRESDFRGRELPDGNRTAPWPIGYSDLEPWYDIAERAMWVHGKADTDPTGPPRRPYSFPPTVHEPVIEDLAKRLRRNGLMPFPLPIAVDQGEEGRCRKGSPCDGFPCRIRAKGDGENAFLRPTLSGDDRIEVHTGVQIETLEHDADGKTIVAAEGLGPHGRVRYEGRIFVLAGGAAGSAKLLLDSISPLHPKGLSNKTGIVGRFFMAHNNSVLMALRPWKKNPTQFQKTLAIHDFYHPGNSVEPLASGGIQMRGKIRPENLARHPSFLVRLFRHAIAARSLDFWVMSEDAGIWENRLEVGEDGNFVLRRRHTNMNTHRNLVRGFRKILRQCGYPIILVRKPRLEAVQHLCGTVRFGNSPESSVLNADCRSWEIENLYACDASVFPSSAAVNPALTVAANALRVANIIRKTLEAGSFRNRRR